MMRRVLLRAALAFSVASLLGVAHAGSTGNQRPCLSGKTFGAWDLPTAGQLGSMTGVLVNEGEPAFHVRARLVPNRSTTRRDGQLRGVLETRTSTGPVSVGRVRGRWIAERGGMGKFRAVVFRPGPTPQAPVQLLGEIEGRFQDPSRTDPGRYQGRWRLCR